MAKNNKARTLGDIAKFKKAEKVAEVKTTKKEIPSSEEIAKAENEAAAKAEEAAATVNNPEEQKTPPAPEETQEKVEETPTPPKETPKKETKEEKKARQKAEYEAKKAAKKEAKAAAKAKAEEQKEEKKEEAPKETPKEKPASKKTDKNAGIEEAVVVEETKTEAPKQKKPETVVVTPEVKTPQAQTKTCNISAAINQLAKGDRMSADRQVEFLGLLKAEYLDKANQIPAEHLAAYQKIFNEGMAMNCLYLHEQVMREGREILGIKMDDKVMPVLTTLLNDCWGVNVHALPAADDGQLRIEFEVPEEVKQAAKDDIAAIETVAEQSKSKTIPEASSDLPEEEKIAAIRAILSIPGSPEAKKEGKDQMSLNIYNAIEWAKKAYGMENNTPAQVTAFMFERLYKNTPTVPIALSGMRSRVFSTLNRYNTMVLPHIILSGLFKFAGYNDEQISDMVKVMLASHLNWIAGKNLAVGKPKGTKFTQEEIENYLIQQGYEQLSTVSDKDVEALLNGVVLKRKFKYLTDADLDGKTCLEAVAKLNGNSENIAKDLIKKVAPFYDKQIERIAKYADFSDYKK